MAPGDAGLDPPGLVTVAVSPATGTRIVSLHTRLWLARRSSAVWLTPNRRPVCELVELVRERADKGAASDADEPELLLRLRAERMAVGEVTEALEAGERGEVTVAIVGRGRDSWRGGSCRGGAGDDGELTTIVIGLEWRGADEGGDGRWTWSGGSPAHSDDVRSGGAKWRRPFCCAAPPAVSCRGTPGG